MGKSGYSEKSHSVPEINTFDKCNCINVQNKLIKVNRALKIVTLCNQIQLRAHEEISLLNEICQIIVNTGGYSLAWVGYAREDENKTVENVACAGSDQGYALNLKVTWRDNQLGQGPTGTAIRTGNYCLIKDIKADTRFAPWKAKAMEYGYESVLALPLINNGETIGALTIYSNEPDAFDEDEIMLLSELTQDMAYGIKTLRIRIQHKKAEENLKASWAMLRKILDGTVTAMSKMTELRDLYTAGHQQKVSNLAAALAKEMKFTPDCIEAIRIAGALHDLGKINIPCEILNKPGLLTPLEFELIKAHPQTGYDILKTVEFPWPIAQIVKQHHERMNGSGYPDGLKGSEILPGARIIAVADVVEAMSCHRPYRPAMGIMEALHEIKEKSGILYDAEVANACIGVFLERNFSF